MALGASLALSSCGESPGGARGVAARLFNVGAAHLADGKFPEAAARLDSALVLADLPEYHVALGHALANQAKYDEAAPHLDIGVVAGIDEARFAVGYLALREGRNEDAITALEPLRAAGDPVTPYLLGTARGRVGETEAAIEDFRQSVDRDPHFISAQYALAQAYQRMGDVAAADAAMERFAYLREHGGTSIDLNGDLGTCKQGVLAETPVPGWRSALGAPSREQTDVRWDSVRALPIEMFVHGTRPEERAGIPPTMVCAVTVDVDCHAGTDLIIANERTVRVLLSNRGKYADISLLSGLPREFTDGGGITGVAAGDLNRDGDIDLVITQWGRTTVWQGSMLRQEPDNSIEYLLNRVSFARAGLELPGATQVVILDVDHDSWLDVVLVPTAAHHGPGPAFELSYWRNNGDGTLTDRSAWAGLDEATLAEALADGEGVTGLAFADVDRDQDVDLLVSSRVGAPVWLENQHDGRFLFADGTPALRPVPVPSELGAGPITAAVGDVAPNGWFDVVLASPEGIATVSTSGLHSFGVGSVVKYAQATTGDIDVVSPPIIQLADVDADGDEDALVLVDGSPRLLLNPGDGISWLDRTESLPESLRSGRVADIVSGGGASEIVTIPKRGAPHVTSIVDAGNALRIRLLGGTSVPDGRGAVLDIAQRTRWQRRILTGPGEITVGLGDEPADVVRVTWPSGIRQAIMAPRTDTVLVIEEKPGESSSCPFVYTWNGEEFEFVADAIGGGVVGVVVEPPDTYNTPDPDEYVLIRGEQLRERDDGLEVRLVEMLEEATMVDIARLIAVRHPEDVEVYPNEYEPMLGPPAEHAVYRFRDARPIRRAVAETPTGVPVDVTDQLAERDRRTVDAGPSLPYKGYGLPHTLTIDLGDIPREGPFHLVWDGWVSYWSTRSILASAYDGVTMIPPRLEIPDGNGGWRTIVEDLGLPPGKPKTIFTDLAGKLPPGVSTVRVVTNLFVYWDRVRVVTEPLTSIPIDTLSLPLRSAELRWVGYPRPEHAAGRPYAYDYERPGDEPLWPSMSGDYTRYGGVAPLLGAVDDRYVIMNHGEEIALVYDPPAPAPEGVATDYFIYVSGYMKEIVPRIDLLMTVDPLPFSGMPAYPYDGALYPDDLRRAMAEWNTRRIE